MIQPVRKDGEPCPTQGGVFNAETRAFMTMGGEGRLRDINVERAEAIVADTLLSEYGLEVGATLGSGVIGTVVKLDYADVEPTEGLRQLLANVGWLGNFQLPPEDNALRPKLVMKFTADTSEALFCDVLNEACILAGRKQVRPLPAALPRIGAILELVQCLGQSASGIPHRLFAIIREDLLSAPSRESRFEKVYLPYAMRYSEPEVKRLAPYIVTELTTTFEDSVGDPLDVFSKVYRATAGLSGKFYGNSWEDEQRRMEATKTLHNMAMMFAVVAGENFMGDKHDNAQDKGEAMVRVMRACAEAVVQSAGRNDEELVRKVLIVLREMAFVACRLCLDTIDFWSWAAYHRFKLVDLHDENIGWGIMNGRPRFVLRDIGFVQQNIANLAPVSSTRALAGFGKYTRRHRGGVSLIGGRP